MKKGLIIAGIILGLIILIICMFVGANNTAIHLEEQIKESKSAINIQEKRREDLIYNLVDTVESYNKYEQDTMTKIVEARAKASSGQVEEAQVLINAVAEKYPELKSNENYKTLMTELSVTENLIAQHRDNYNVQVKQYNKHVRTFPNSMILNMMGYEKLDNSYLEYDASEDAPRNLFKD
ncbi:LemA family protein [uncultured Clostridium sp.]|uniref:LemA family protein n=1 Tax=uncultured Clostridium sp. TaxID=59620 RepID=UPI0026ECF792|nr:LemA family protein [uncultured Clostridium sp.]